MIRHGAVLVFKPGTPKAEAVEAIKKIQHLLDPNYFIKPDPEDLVKEYESDHCRGPSWYLP